MNVSAKTKDLSLDTWTIVIEFVRAIHSGCMCVCVLRIRNDSAKQMKQSQCIDVMQSHTIEYP